MLDALCKGPLPRGRLTHGNQVRFDYITLSWRDRLFYMNREERRSKATQDFQADVDKTIAEHCKRHSLQPGDDLGQLTEVVQEKFHTVGMLTPRPVKLTWVDGKVFLGLQEP